MNPEDDYTMIQSMSTGSISSGQNKHYLGEEIIAQTVDESDVENVRPARELLTLRLTKVELAHLRDMLSIRLPPDLQKTVSQSLAEKENRPLSETNLWNRIGEMCESSGVPVGDDAPDFIVGISGLPELRVFEISTSPIEESGDNDEGKPTSPFGKDA